tara:strand:+ start:369 stop:764 length:396 start_codon:yes stop_codon:yes gene_type:complete
MTEQIELKTNHNVRVVNLANGQNVLCLFGDIRDGDQDNKVIGYRMLYPFALSLGTENEDGTIPIEYKRWCPYSPQEEHRLSGEHIVSVVFPDNGILDNYTNKLKELGVPEETIFPTEVTDGSEGELAETSE